MTESDADYQNHSWQVSVKNSGRETVTPAIYLQWIDKNGFVIQEEFVDNSREIYPGETETFRGTSLIDNQEVDQFYEVTCKITE